MKIAARSLHTIGVSTLLIPARCIRMLDRALHGRTMNELLRQLTCIGVPTIRPAATRIRYQSKGGDLVRRDFRVSKAVWFRLGQMARALGVSRCLLFIVLLDAFSNNLSEFRQIAVGVTWRLLEIFDFARTERIAYLDRGDSPVSPGRSRPSRLL